MTDIFISYSRKDVEMISTLAQTLESLGYVVWWDVNGLHGGEAFAEVIQEKLSEAMCAIVVWSEHSVKSKWVQSEASFADSRDILLTVMYQDSIAPMPFNTRHNEDLKGWDGSVTDEGFQKLLKAIKRLCPSPSGNPDMTGPLPNTAAGKDAKGAIVINKSEFSIASKKVYIFVSLLLIALLFFFYSKDLLIDHEPVALESRQDSSRVNDVRIVQLSRASEKALEEARDALADNRLTGPKNINALRYAEKVLKEAPGNTEAIGVIAEISSRLQSWAELSAQKEHFHNAQHYLDASGKLIKKYSIDKLDPMQKKLSVSLKVAKETSVSTDVEKPINEKIYVLAKNLKLLPMPAGSFMMGRESVFENESPAHKVTFAEPFWMSQTEVTFEQYDAYVKAAGVDSPSASKLGRGKQPVINVSWDDAQGFMKWLTASNNQGLRCRLPSEAEWEYAARAATSTAFFWGDKATAENKANCFDCGSQWDRKSAAPVGSFPENPWGLQDMHGNVREWVQDRWHENYINAPENGVPWTRNGHPQQGINRGGSSFDTASRINSYVRYAKAKYFRLDNLGFRVACSLIND